MKHLMGCKYCYSGIFDGCTRIGNIRVIVSNGSNNRLCYNG